MNRETITEKAYIIGSEFNDDDLEIFIKELKWWLKERKTQNDEVKILKKRFEIVKKIEELRNDLSYYEKELEEYNNGVYGSYVRDLEYTIEEIQKEIQKIESENEDNE